MATRQGATRLRFLGAPNSDTSLDLGLGPHLHFLLALIGLTNALSRCNYDANSTMTAESHVLSSEKRFKLKEIFYLASDVATSLLGPLRCFRLSIQIETLSCRIGCSP